MELTKEYFDKGLETLIEHFDEELDQKLDQKLGEKLHNLATKDDLLELASRQNLLELQETVDDIQIKVTRIDKRTDEDTRAVMKDIIKLRKEVRMLKGGQRIKEPLVLKK